MFRNNKNIKYILSLVPGKRRFGIYRFLPIFFCMGGVMEWVMIKVRIGRETFCKYLLYIFFFTVYLCASVLRTYDVNLNISIAIKRAVKRIQVEKAHNRHEMFENFRKVRIPTYLVLMSRYCLMYIQYYILYFLSSVCDMHVGFRNLFKYCNFQSPLDITVCTVTTASLLQ